MHGIITYKRDRKSTLNCKSNQKGSSTSGNSTFVRVRETLHIAACVVFLGYSEREFGMGEVITCKG